MQVVPKFFAPDDPQHFHSVVTHSVHVRSHFDVLVWLEGDMQRYLPHDILIAAWGNFQTGALRYDILTSLDGVRSNCSDRDTCPASTECITPMLLSLFNRWAEFGKKPLGYNVGESGFLLQDLGLQCALGAALQKMRSTKVHGIIDERGSHDCLYVTFSRHESVTDPQRCAMAMVLPYIDTALRQVEHLPHQLHTKPSPHTPAVVRLVPKQKPEHDLTLREREILEWVTLGKTNPEIGTILNISEFTVKNHMQRMFKKLNVTNRAQAVGKLQGLAVNG